MTLRLLIVDDHTAFGQALSALAQFEHDMEVVKIAQTGAAALTTAEHMAVDVAIVDLDLPDMPGVDVVVALRQRPEPVPCVVLTASNDQTEFGLSVEAGASAVLHKSVEVVDVFDVVRDVARGRTRLDPSDVATWLRALAQHRERGWQQRVAEDLLTTRERDILQLLAEGQRTSQIARALHISPATVQTHVRNLRMKLGAGTQLEAVVEGQRLGLISRPKSN